MPSLTTSPRHNDEIQSSQRKNALAHSATDTTAHTPAQDEKPLYIPSYWERKDGYFKDGVFHKPSYEIFNNGEPLEPLGVSFGYRYEVADHILIHLQAVSTDNFIIKPTSWQPMNDFNVVMEGNA